MWGGGIGSSSRPKNCWHSWGILPGGYPQQDDKIDKWHRGGRPHTFARKLRSVDATQAPWTEGHREKKLQPAKTDRGRVLLSWGTPQVRRHNGDISYPVPSDQYCLRHASPDGQVRAIDSRVELHAGSAEDLGLFQTFFLDVSQGF